MPIDMAGGSVTLTQCPRSLPDLLSPGIFLQSSGLGFLVAAYGSPAAAQLSLGSHTSVCLLPPPQLDHHTAMHMCWGSPAPGRGHGAKVAPCRRTNRWLQLGLSRRRRRGESGVRHLGGEEEALRRCSKSEAGRTGQQGGESPAPEARTTRPPGRMPSSSGREEDSASTIPPSPDPPQKPALWVDSPHPCNFQEEVGDGSALP
jgi:hypothetical protein